MCSAHALGRTTERPGLAKGPASLTCESAASWHCSVPARSQQRCRPDQSFFYSSSAVPPRDDLSRAFQQQGVHRLTLQPDLHSLFAEFPHCGLSSKTPKGKLRENTVAFFTITP